MALWFEDAALSLDVYRDADRPPLPDGWSVLVDCPPQYATGGYFGAAYIHVLTEAPNLMYEVVMAHRGTYSWVDTIEDYLVLVGQAPDTLRSNALPFLAYVQDYINKHYPNAQYLSNTIEQTGHSLGAILAELTVASQTQPCGGATTFESPGSKPIIQNQIDKGFFPKDAVETTSKLVASDFADIDAINTCNEQINPFAEPFPILPYNYDADGGVLDPPPGMLYYFEEFTCKDQHRMINFYNKWKQAPHIKAENLKKANLSQFNWPIGLSNSFNYYVTFGNHNDYWLGYAQNYWDRHPEIHSTYDNDVGKYQDFFLYQSGYLRKPSVPHELFHKPQHGFNHLTPEQRLARAKDIDEKLYIAVYCGNTALAKELLKLGANPNAKHGVNKIPLLHISILRGDIDMLNTLLEHNASPNATDILGNNALHLIATERYQDATRFARPLLQHGVNSEALNHHGQKPLDIMKKYYDAKFSMEFEKELAEGYVLVNANDMHDNKSSGCTIM